MRESYTEMIIELLPEADEMLLKMIYRMLIA